MMIQNNCQENVAGQCSLKLYKTLNDNLDDLNFEQVTVFDQMRCSTRQINFEIERNNNFKSGMNTVAVEREREKRTTTTNFHPKSEFFLKSTLRVPVGRSGRKLYHRFCGVLGHILASRKLSKCQL